MSVVFPSTQSTEHERERVQRGIALLDERGPKDWRRRVDVATLDVCNPWRCVIGQVYGGYASGLAVLELVEPGEDYGFDCRRDEAAELNAAWRAALAAGRR